MNFVNGTLKIDNGAVEFTELQGGTIKLGLQTGARAREFGGKPVLLGIRPEDIELAQFATTNERSTSSFPAIVDIVEPMGAETNLYLQTGMHTVVCRSQKALDHREAGRRFQFDINLEKTHLFDADTGVRIA